MSGLTGVTERTRTARPYFPYARVPPISIRARTSPMPARGSPSNSVSPPNARRGVSALDGEADGVPEPG